MSAHPWPLFDLRVRTPNLELRLPTDDDLLELARVARAGIVAAGVSERAQEPTPAWIARPRHAVRSAPGELRPGRLPVPERAHLWVRKRGKEEPTTA
jgi:hypothetical protein